MHKTQERLMGSIAFFYPQKMPAAQRNKVELFNSYIGALAF